MEDASRPENDFEDVDKPKDRAALRKEYEEAAAEVRECEKALTKAKKRLIAADVAMQDSSPQLPLHELNRRQRKINATETRRRYRAQEALDQIKGFYRPGAPSHPPLWRGREPQVEE